jgi:CheY-like chemotaxis protein
VHLLLVDDSADNQRLFERILTSVGAKVDLAENGAVAVARAQATNYDVIIMDIRMPEMDGYEATRKIREQGFTGPIVALTAHANPGEEERCRAAGCSGFYLKPINRAGLLQAVTDAL